ncbi:MAG: TIM barrel protein [Planctomycetes bacterium]|nr:TIM barrel protein [Planctomycetota bacterium]
MKTNRHDFLALTLGLLAAGCTRMSDAKEVKPHFKISLAQWTLQKELFSGKIDNLDFAKVASDHQIFGLEYVNQFFMNKTNDSKYLGEMKTRAEDLGVESILIMVDREGDLGDPDEKKRMQAVDNHRKWIDTAKFLGCHSIRVNARSRGAYGEQVSLAVDGLSKLTEVGAGQGINVIVENHGGLSSNADWLSEVMEKVNHPMCGTLPDTGNFKIKKGVSYDSYRGMKKLMKWAKGVSIKQKVYDDHGNSSPMDFVKMLQIVADAGWRGYCGIEFGGYAGLNQSRTLLEEARAKLT